MQSAPIPVSEPRRLHSLMEYEILDTAPEKEYEDLTELAARLCGCPFAMISFIDTDRQWFKATKGVALSETLRTDSFCGHTILKDKVMVVKDVSKDHRFADNPYTKNPFSIAFYAGAPIEDTTGQRLGTVCVMDQKPRKRFTSQQKDSLKIISRQVFALMERGKQNKNVQRDLDAKVAEEKQIVLKTITEQDEEKNFIANELHENFAQTLAATKLYLDFAEQSQEMSRIFIKKSKENILQIIKDIKALSRSILPSTFEHINYLDFIEEMLTEYGRQTQKEIKFKHTGKLDCYDANIGLTIFRIIQYQLRNAVRTEATKVNISIKTSKRLLKLKISDNGKEGNPQEPERKMLVRHINTRIGLLNGTTSLTAGKNHHNQLEIEIPLV